MENISSWFIYLLVANVIGFYLMFKDKQKAKQHAYRIPERTFWLLAILGGSIGLYIGMQTFRHKTKHKSFTIGIPIFIIVNVISFIGLIFFL
ncbi:DUF1294 domain-containing protein [Oceanobacillus neutriphilus]|uniref:DUF1294 domain-containing protein n=1 Tax=Oceanobacillus neutriphilus TaxID=531815 RepID=A0ABQ2NXZ7_9BACI|nr:DUF1294 domain-containing protein [Oceanobacillus neutriphilus]GGP13358.1 hypothetical protein GCM10011346_33030 [Oceanobacillus neutriphilus]